MSAAAVARTEAVSSKPATGLRHLTWRLARARFSTREGESLLFFAGILAYTVAAALALTVAGGTWMFFQRWKHPSGIMAEVLAIDPTFDILGIFYFVLALIACALLIPAVVNLTAGAAVLGARGRERRLAALRLLGLSSGDVTRMSLLDALIQSLIGAVLGIVVYLATLPAWHALTMEAMPIKASEMLLPAWLFALVVAAIVVIGLLAAARGLRQVRISPLGVARRANKPKLSWLRAVLFVGVVIVAVIGINVFRPSTDITIWVVFAAVIVLVVAGMNIVAPWLLQQAARGFAHLPGPVMRWSARRIAADPGATWRRVSGVALISFVGGYVALMPFNVNQALGDSAPVLQKFTTDTHLDFTKGAIITLAVGFVLTAVSMMISQASATIERAEQSTALHRMGAPRGYSLRVMWAETFGPLAVGVILGSALGVLLAWPMFSYAKKMGLSADTSVTVMGVVLGFGLLIAALALLACHPLYNFLLLTQRRRND